MKLASGGVPENSGGRGFIMVLEDKSVGMLWPGGQPVPKGLLCFGVLLLVLGSGDGLEECSGSVDSVI